jgi:hypothetical protein
MSPHCPFTNRLAPVGSMVRMLKVQAEEVSGEEKIGQEVSSEVREIVSSEFSPTPA